MIGWIILAAFLLALFGLGFAGASKSTKPRANRDGDMDVVDHHAKRWIGIF